MLHDLPILCATSPDTPVSISSKMMEGSALYCESIALTANIMRDNSPPEATFLRGQNLNLYWQKM